MGVAVIEARGKKCFKEGVVKDLSDLPTLPWLCMVMEPPRKKPRINEAAPWPSSINSSTGRKTRARVFSPHMHRPRREHVDSMEGKHPQARSRALSRNQVTWKRS